LLIDIVSIDDEFYIQDDPVVITSDFEPKKEVPLCTLPVREIKARFRLMGLLKKDELKRLSRWIKSNGKSEVPWG